MATYTESNFQFPQSGKTGENSPRLPWNNTIFPGNYVAHLNAYRDQNVQAFPGVNFFRAVGAFVVNKEDLDNNGELADGDYTISILSPDLRQDDKPRKDRDMVLRGTMGGGGIGIYRIAVNTVNLMTAKTDANNTTVTPKFTGDTIASGSIPVHTSANGDAGGLFPVGGTFSEFKGFAEGSSNALVKYSTSDITVEATVSANHLKLIDPGKEAAILVEVCFIANAPAPDADDVHLPFPTESGQSEQ